MATETIELIQKSLVERRPLRIRYRSQTGSGITTRDIEVRSYRHPYLTAFCRLRGDLRTFRADRILDARLVGEKRLAPPIQFLPLETALHPKCAYCSVEFELDEPTVWCPRCEVQYHDDCARVQGICAIYGCSGRLRERQGVAAATVPEREMQLDRPPAYGAGASSIAPWMLAAGVVCLLFSCVSGGPGVINRQTGSVMLVVGIILALSSLAVLGRGRRR